MTVAGISNQLPHGAASEFFPRFLWAATANRLGTREGTSWPACPRALCSGVVARSLRRLHAGEWAWSPGGGSWGPWGGDEGHPEQPAILLPCSGFSVKRASGGGCASSALAVSSLADKPRDTARAIHWGGGQAEPRSSVCGSRFRVCGSDSQPPLEAPRMSPGGKASGCLMRIWAECLGHPQPPKPTAVQRPGGFQGCVLSPLAGPGRSSGLAHGHLLGRESGRLQGLIWRLRLRQDLCLIRQMSL